jgi:hypothetical protein
MLFGFLASLVALVSYTFALPFIAISYTLLYYIITVSVWLGSYSFSAFVIPQAITFEAIGIFLALSALAFVFFSKRKPS